MKTTDDLSIGRMMANINRLQASSLDQRMDQIGLFRGQAILLLVLGEHDGLTHSEIAEKLQISPAAATKVIKRMEERHYLQRCSDAADERRSRVYLQAEGRAVLAQVHQVFQSINQVLMTGFSPEEQQTLRAFLKRIHANLLAQQAESAARPAD